MGEPTGRDRAALLAMLGLPPDAVQPEITRSYRRLARQTHPDLAAGPDQTAAARRFAEITDAYHRVLDTPPSAERQPPTERPHPQPEVRVAWSPDEGPPVEWVDEPPAWPRRRTAPRRPQPPIVPGPAVVRPVPPTGRRPQRGA